MIYTTLYNTSRTLLSFRFTPLVFLCNTTMSHTKILIIVLICVTATLSHDLSGRAERLTECNKKLDKGCSEVDESKLLVKFGGWKRRNRRNEKRHYRFGEESNLFLNQFKVNQVVKHSTPKLRKAMHWRFAYG